MVSGESLERHKAKQKDFLGSYREHFAFSALALGLLFFLYYGSFSRGPYIDDNSLIFSNPFIREARNPLFYWYRGQGDTKAWPFAHTAYWLAYQAFHVHLWAYRACNLLIHWGTGTILFVTLARRVRFFSAALAASLFWFHPVTVETVTWVAQLGTLLFTLFFSGWLAALLAVPERGKQSFFFFVGMVATKGFAYFLPFLVLRRRAAGKVGRAILSTAPLFIVTAYSLFLTWVGVHKDPIETRHSQTYYQTLSSETGEPTEAEGELLPLGSWNVFNEIYEKFAVSGKIAAFYFCRVVFYSEILSPEMKASSYSSMDPLFFLLGLGALTLLAWCFLRRIFVWVAGLLVFLPVSGLFYAPFMKYSLVSDRMIYPGLYAFAWGVGLFYDRLENRALRRALWGWPLLLFAIAFFVVRLPRAEFPMPGASYERKLERR